MNSTPLFILLILLAFSCQVNKKKRKQTNEQIPTTKYEFEVYDSLSYHKYLAGTAIRVGGTRYSHNSIIVRTDSIVIHYKRNGQSVYDTILNPFVD